MNTHRDYKISYEITKNGVTTVLARFYTGEYVEVIDEITGKAKTEYQRSGRPTDREYEFNSDNYDRDRLISFIDDELGKEGALPSISEQIKEREPLITAIRSKEISRVAVAR